MPVIRLQRAELERLGISKDILIENVSMLGADLKDASGEEILVEFFPDRPDLYTVEGVVRALKYYAELEKPKKYKLKEGSVEINVNASVKRVRPFVVGAVIRNIEVDNLMIKSMMDFQEKLHFTVGRKRKKVAIGIHDFDKVKPPFIYTTKPPEFSFVPLGFDEEMPLKDIIERHPKGREYAHLIPGDEMPVILDSEGNVLSFPPIINGVLTQVTESTRNIFIDMTGTDLKTLMGVLNIVSTAFADRGATVETVKVRDSNVYETPQFIYERMNIDVSMAKSMLGIQLTNKDIENSLSRMGYIVKGNVVEIPPYRMDILHPVDIIEDIAKGYGYQRITPSTITKYVRGKGFEWEERFRLSLIGLGFVEIKSLTLSSFREQYDLMNLQRVENVVVENPVSEGTETLRTWILPSLMAILRKNKHRELPQRVFELGYVRSKSLERHVAFLWMDAKVGFTESKSVIERLLSDLGISEYNVAEKSHGSFIAGRCAAIMLNGEEIGFFGEIHPHVLENFELTYPVVGGEINVEKFRGLLSEIQ